MEPTYHIRLLAILTADDDAANPTMVLTTEIEDQVAEANTIYAAGGMRFHFDPALDTFRINSTLLNQDFTVLENLADCTDQHVEPPVSTAPHDRARDTVARLFRGRLVVYYSHGSTLRFSTSAGHWTVTGRSNSFSGTELWYVAGHATGTELNHEAGHYLQLPHTFASRPSGLSDAAEAIRRYVEDDGHPVTDGLDVFDGDRDWVTDTPADAGKAVFGTTATCGTANAVPIPVTFTKPGLPATRTFQLRPDFANAMSYFYCPTKRMSGQQLGRMRDALEDGLRHHIVSLRASELSGTVTRRGATGKDDAGTASNVSVVMTRAYQVVVALRDGDGNLKLTSWDISKDGKHIARGQSQGSTKASRIALVSMGLGVVCTAVEHAGTLRVTSWRVDPNGEISQLDAAEAGQISRVAACRVGRNYLATVVRDGAGMVRRIIWIVAADGTLTKGADEPSGPVDDVGAVGVGTDVLATARRNAQGELEVSLWRIGDGGHQLAFVTARSGGAVDAIAVCTLDWDLFAIVVREGNGVVKVIAWHVSPDGQVLERRGDAEAGAVEQPFAACRVGIDLLASAVRDGAGELRVILWTATAEGEYVARRGSGSGGLVGDVSICRAGPDLLATAVQNGAGNLEIIVWAVS